MSDVLTWILYPLAVLFLLWAFSINIRERWRNRKMIKRAKAAAEEKGEVPEDPRDLMEPPLGKPDPVVEDRFNYFAEQLENHVGKNLGSYRLSLLKELEWIKHEKKIRRALTRSLP